jgi:membrane-associated phospholipid phosphatase
VYVWLALLAAPRLQIARGAVLVGLGVVAAVAVGLTRVYLRAHFLSDVLGGWGVGLAAFAIPTAVAAFVVVTRVGNNQSDAAPAR